MTRPRIIIADTDINYIIPLQLKFAEDFFGKIDLEIITKREYFDILFSNPQKADVLIISEDLYNASLRLHNINNIFLMTEQYTEEKAEELNVSKIHKYTSIKEIFNEIVGKSILSVTSNEKKETIVIVFYSACGGTGKTTLAVGVSASLVKNYKKVLYIGAEHLQTFGYIFKNSSPLPSSDAYSKFSAATDDLYYEVKHVIRKELFDYFPPFRASLMSLDLNYSIYKKLILSAKKSNDYDFIIVDADVSFDNEKADLLNLADKVVVVTNQNIASVSATNILVSNINGVNAEKYVFVCNNFNKSESNALISSNRVKFSVGDYVNKFENFDKMTIDEISNERDVQKVAFLVI